MEAKRKKCKVIMLSTDERSSIILSSTSVLNYYKKTILARYGKNQHLYITSDDEIKEGDCVCENNLNKETSIYHIYKKHNRLCFFRFRNVPIWLDEDQHNAKKIIATTDKFLEIITPKIDGFNDLHEPLPQPSKAFIEKYCEKGGIDEVMVEYKEDNNPSLWGQDIGIALQKPKINSHNEITIHSVKDSWTREEIHQLLENCRQYCTMADGTFVDKVREFVKQL